MSYLKGFVILFLQRTEKWVNKITYLQAVGEILLQSGLLSKCLRLFRTVFQMVGPHTPLESGSATFLELVPIQRWPL